MQDLKKNIFISVYSINTNKQYFINNIETKYKNIFLRDAIEASMAAPTLFPLKIIYFNDEEDDNNEDISINYDILMDPGIILNNSVMQYIMHVKDTKIL